MLSRKCLLVIRMLLDLNTDCADIVADLCFRAMSLCFTSQLTVVAHFCLWKKDSINFHHMSILVPSWSLNSLREMTINKFGRVLNWHHYHSFTFLKKCVEVKRKMFLHFIHFMIWPFCPLPKFWTLKQGTMTFTSEGMDLMNVLVLFSFYPTCVVIEKTIYDN